MELRTYTSLWQIERRLYRLDDITLPTPPTYRQIGIFFGFGLPWIGLMALLQVPLMSQWGFPLYAVPVIGIPIFANRPVAESKTGLELVASQLRFFTRGRTLAALRAAPVNTSSRLVGWLWQRDPQPR